MTMHIVQRATDGLVPYARNACTHSPEQVALLAASIREWGWTNPILIDGENRILAGHGRLAAAKSLGMTVVPCVVLGAMSEAQRRAYILADNQLAARAGWDTDLLALELGELKALGFDLDLTGFEPDDLLRLLGPDAGGGLTDDDEAPACPDSPVSAPGDLWRCGEHRVLCGDALSMADMARLMDGAQADLIISDPPYNVAYAGKSKRRLTITNDAMSAVAFYRFLLDAFTMMFAVAADGAGAYVFHSDVEGANFRRAFSDAGFRFAQCCVWVKSTFVLGRKDYQIQHEPVLYGWKPGDAHRWYGDRRQSSVWNFDRPAASDLHPTMKPVAMVEYAVLNSSRSGELVLDPFAGSGTALVACEKTGRCARVLEIDPRYCDVTVRRWQDWTGKKAIREDGLAFDEAGGERRAHGPAHGYSASSIPA
ncbi:hypothetical protein R75461_07768 [Paraburkholderia nemoris]|uniref:site-specific DNA-methyltransferase n=1 Tax=Paraburkholderia nemoris TaxID=2793076 RepID=UPI00190B86F7|nr:MULTISPECIES: site-specific DNA-methyltransferase [Paraburkholderia]MBK3786533.1 site-specific DNA-methyltransferase [Paraburkholderia aspalathi]CAE6857030.1 hypothetical protein R75461_07768 [Paraburkholderia nemoris]